MGVISRNYSISTCLYCRHSFLSCTCFRGPLSWAYVLGFTECLSGSDAIFAWEILPYCLNWLGFGYFLLCLEPVDINIVGRTYPPNRCTTVLGVCMVTIRFCR